MVSFLVGCFALSTFFEQEKVDIQEIRETRGMFISYIELSNYLKGKDKKEGEKSIKNMVSNVYDLGFNMIVLQVRTFSDAIYPSSIFPWSSVVSREEGVALDYDVLDTFLNFCHKKNMKLFAWINPYRIRGDEDASDLSEDNPAVSYLNTDSIYISDGIYYNPAKEENKKLIVSGVKEIVKNYDVDGVLFDDYFYPSTEESIDLEEFTSYKKEHPSITLSEFRIMQVNDLIKRVYEVCHEYDTSFAISPDGNIENNYEMHYADVRTWGSKKGYVDYLMPQIYYGFYNEVKPFVSVLEEWEQLSTKVSLMPVLAFYKVGAIDKFAKEGMNEWIENSDIIMREVLLSRNLAQYQGFSLFRYDYLFNTDLQTNTTMAEVKNMKKVIK